jgi:predicted acetyltransferase
VLTSLMRAQLADVQRRGEPIAALWASEEVIYRRFGYGLASLSCEIGIPSGYASLRERRDERASARLVPLDAGNDLLAPVYERVRAGTPGMFVRTDAWWETRTLADPPDRRQGGGEKNALLLELDGAPCACTRSSSAAPRRGTST